MPRNLTKALNPDMAKRVTTEARDTFDILAAFDTNPGTLLGPLAKLRRSFTPPKPLWLTRVEQRGATPEELVRRVVRAKAGGASAFIWMWALNFDSGWRGFLMPMASWKTKDRLPVYAKKTGVSTGYIEPPGDWGVGWMDACECLSVHRRKNGEYLIIEEDDGRRENLMYRWNPGASSSFR